MIDQDSYTHNLSSWEITASKNIQAWTRFKTHDRFDAYISKQLNVKLFVSCGWSDSIKRPLPCEMLSRLQKREASKRVYTWLVQWLFDYAGMA